MQRPSHSELSLHLFPPSLVGTTQAGEPVNPTGCIAPPEASHLSAGGTCKVEGDGSRVWQLAKSKKRAAAQRVANVRIGSAIPLSQTGSNGVAFRISAFGKQTTDSGHSPVAWGPTSCGPKVSHLGQTRQMSGLAKTGRAIGVACGNDSAIPRRVFHSPRAAPRDHRARGGRIARQATCLFRRFRVVVAPALRHAGQRNACWPDRRS